jgi:hypothetical protein
MSAAALPCLILGNVGIDGRKKTRASRAFSMDEKEPD